jgi:hypothetical protein
MLVCIAVTEDALVVAALGRFLCQRGFGTVVARGIGEGVRQMLPGVLEELA